jgi:hypothetical protein
MSTRNDKTLTVVATAVFQVDVSGPTFVDETTDATDAGSADWTVFPATEAVGDYVAFCSQEKFTRIVLDSAGGTAGVGGLVEWRYLAPDGSWQLLPNVVDGSAGFTVAIADGQNVAWEEPEQWTARTLNSVTGYWVAAFITQVFSTNPVYDQCFVGGFDGKGDRGRVAPTSGEVDGTAGTNASERYVLTHASLRVLSGAITSWRLIKWDPVADQEVSEIDNGGADTNVDLSGGITIPLDQAGVGSCEVRFVIVGQTGSVRCVLDGVVSA